MHAFPTLDVVGVPRSQLVVEAGDELVVDGLRHLFHLHFTYLCSFRFARLTKRVEGRLGSQGSPVAAGLAADPGPFAAGGHGDGNVVQAEGGLRLWPRTPRRAASDLWQRPIPGLALRLRVDPEDLRLAPLGPPLLLDEVVVHGSAFLHPVQGLHIRGPAGPRGVRIRAATRGCAPAHEVRSRVEPSFDGPRPAYEGSTCCRHGQAARRRTHGARRCQGSLAQQRQGSRTSLCRGCRFRCSRHCLRSSGEAFRCFRLRELLGGEALDVLRRRALHLRRPLPRPLQQGLYFRRPAPRPAGGPVPVGASVFSACGPASRRA